MDQDRDDQGRALVDPDFERLAPSFNINGPTGPEDIRLSAKLFSFLEWSKGREHSEFSRSDAQKIEDHRAAFPNDHLRIINEVNARSYEILSRFDRMTFAELTTVGVLEYANAMERIEADMEQRLADHHMKLLDSLSAEGRKRALALLDSEITPKLLRSMSYGQFDWRGFATTYPEVMARQLLLETSQVTGPPPELDFREIRNGPLGMIGTLPTEE
jgi:hypothetical protein